ncbi:lysine N(6)-hydroxylase/L-ornithine N(5)-oxygenase family protein [Skermania piniformis]|uniref:L-lysine N6-monooxygenase MbtG n=1 Tax=Skermania pinensis TaxID=39122 RepID=A0ABX8S7K4_9ACTN|nr:SidA/IucD/PvdA family monooxygenase [Skermania piniformis]QXQ13825.1 lysine N(6)-hydroxylase/L-ornithine N(5)-oxygenase family protein [Skermania piniformis]
MSARPESAAVVDVLGVGFGPSNLGLAIAIAEHNEAAPKAVITARFIEAKEKFGWHPEMMLPGATMQVSFLKDLVTQRNARSYYTFLNYLTHRGRLNDFVNHQTFFPTRVEFADYLEWAADAVRADVGYGSRATSVRWAGDCFVVEVAGSTPETIRARNVVLASGLTGVLPDGITPSGRVFHNHGLLGHLARLPRSAEPRFVVIGSGQSAAEVVEYLHANYPSAGVHAVFGKYGFTPADDSPYANRIFDPAAVDDYFSSPPELRRRLMDYHRSTNYSAVDGALIETLYAREYAERVRGPRRLFIHGASRVASVTDFGGWVDVVVEHGPAGLEDTLRCDAVICATGFRPIDLPALLGDFTAEVEFDAEGVRVARDYRVITKKPIPGGLYLQGGTEHTHGISSSLLSNIAVRSDEIVKSIAQARVLTPV